MSYQIQHSNQEISDSIDAGLEVYNAGASASANDLLTWNGTEWEAAPKPSYTATEVGADPAGSADAVVSSVLTGTLTAAGWSGNAQTLTISGLVVSGFAYTVAPASASLSDWKAAEIYADDITTANSITFHCTTTPTSAISVNILKVKVA